MNIREYDSGKGRCVQCGKATLHTRKISEEIRVRVCKECEQKLPDAFWDGVITMDAKYEKGDNV